MNQDIFIGLSQQGLMKISGEETTIYTTTNSGLPTNNIKDVLQMSDGTIYIATYSGLVKYDGKNWTTYNTSNSTIYTNRIQTLVEGSDNSLYLGTYDFGVIKYTGKHFIGYPSINFPSKQTWGLCQSQSGDLYAGTSLGIAKFNGSTWDQFTTNNTDLPDNYIKCIIETKDGILYIGTKNGGLVKYDGKNWITYNTSNSPLPYNTIGSLTIGTDNNIYIGTAYGITQFDGKDQWKIYNSNNSALVESGISDIITSKTGDIYFSQYTYIGKKHQLKKNYSNYRKYIL